MIQISPSKGRAVVSSSFYLHNETANFQKLKPLPDAVQWPNSCLALVMEQAIKEHE
jgi:hypothetical protein